MTQSAETIRRARTIQIRASDAEYERYAKATKADGVHTMSEWIRLTLDKRAAVLERKKATK